MGQTLSCLDPARESQRDTFVKNRSYASQQGAESKRKRRDRGFHGLFKKTNSVAKDVGDDDSQDQQKSVPDTTTAVPLPGNTSVPPVTESDADASDIKAVLQETESPEVAEQLAHDVASSQPDQSQNPQDASSPRSTAATMASDAPASAQKDSMAVADENLADQNSVHSLPVHNDIPVNESSPDNRSSEDKPNAQPIKVPDAEAVPAGGKQDVIGDHDETWRHSSQRGKLRLSQLNRAAFDSSVDQLPDPKPVEQMVLDPVTGQMVSQEEFRQRVKTRGLVRHHVSKFENIDEKAARDRAKVQAQHEARAKSRKTVKAWDLPRSPSGLRRAEGVSISSSLAATSYAPSSPIPFSYDEKTSDRTSDMGSTSHVEEVPALASLENEERIYREESVPKTIPAANDEGVKDAESADAPDVTRDLSESSPAKDDHDSETSLSADAIEESIEKTAQPEKAEPEEKIVEAEMLEKDAQTAEDDNGPISPLQQHEISAL